MATTRNEHDSLTLPAFDTLVRPKSPWNKNPEERASMTIACKDADNIPRVENAGGTKHVNGVAVQIMHNGLMVKKGGYQGEWQATIIKKLRGVHEPQEEKVFYEVLKKLEKGATIMELGSWWSYYSMWLLKQVPRSKAICCEPDPANLELGKANAKLNGFKVGEQMVFYEAASGSKDGKIIKFQNEDGSITKVPIRTVDSIVEEQKPKMLDVLHLDIQGAELDALRGAVKSIRTGKIRFLFVSTHHYSISYDPLMHQKCLDFISRNGGTIIAAHSILESTSGDGLIVASFKPEDTGFKVHVSLQPSDDALFRAYEYDTDILWKAHDKLAKYAKELEKTILTQTAQLATKDNQIQKLQSEIEEINTVKKHLKRQLNIRTRTIKTKIKK